MADALDDVGNALRDLRRDEAVAFEAQFQELEARLDDWPLLDERQCAALLGALMNLSIDVKIKAVEQRIADREAEHVRVQGACTRHDDLCASLGGSRARDKA